MHVQSSSFAQKTSLSFDVVVVLVVVVAWGPCSQTLGEHVVENEAVLRVILFMHRTKKGQNLNSIYLSFK